MSILEIARGAALISEFFYPLKGRRALNADDKARHRWVAQGDGNNRASIRKEMAHIPREAKKFKRGQMTHAKDIEALRQPDVCPSQGTESRNFLKARRKSRTA